MPAPCATGQGSPLVLLPAPSPSCASQKKTQRLTHCIKPFFTETRPQIPGSLPGPSCPGEHRPPRCPGPPHTTRAEADIQGGRGAWKAGEGPPPAPLRPRSPLAPETHADLRQWPVAAGWGAGCRKRQGRQGCVSDPPPSSPPTPRSLVVDHLTPFVQSFWGRKLSTGSGFPSSPAPLVSHTDTAPLVLPLTKNCPVLGKTDAW